MSELVLDAAELADEAVVEVLVAEVASVVLVSLVADVAAGEVL